MMLYFQFQVVVFEPAIWLFLTIVTVFCHGDSLQKWRGKAETVHRLVIPSFFYFNSARSTGACRYMGIGSNHASI